MKDLADTKFALDQASIVATDGREGPYYYVNEKFANLQISSDEMLGRIHRIINSAFHRRNSLGAVAD